MFGNGTIQSFYPANLVFSSHYASSPYPVFKRSPHPITLASGHFLYRFAQFHVHVTALTAPLVLYCFWLITHLPAITITPTTWTILGFPASCHIQPILHMTTRFSFLKCGSSCCLFLPQIFQCLSTVYRMNLTPFLMVNFFHILAPFILPSSPPCLPYSHTPDIFGFLWNCSALKFPPNSSFSCSFCSVLFKTSSSISVCQDPGHSSRPTQIPLLRKAILDYATLLPMPAGQSSLYLFLFSSLSAITYPYILLCFFLFGGEEFKIHKGSVRILPWRPLP